MVFNCGQLCLPGDMWRCLETILIVTTEGGRKCYWHRVGKRPGMLLHILQFSRQPPPHSLAMNYPTQNFNSEETEKPWYLYIYIYMYWVAMCSVPSCGLHSKSVRAPRLEDSWVSPAPESSSATEIDLLHQALVASAPTRMIWMHYSFSPGFLLLSALPR